MPRPKPPYFPAVMGLYMNPTIVNNAETLATIPWIMSQRRRSLRRARQRKVQRHQAHRGVGPRQEARYLRSRVRRGHLPRGLLRPVARRRHPRRQRTQGLHSRRRFRRPGSSPSTSTCRWRRRWSAPAGAMLGSGAIVAMDDTTDMVAACWRLVKFYARESLRQVHAVSRRHELARNDPGPHPRRPRPPRRPRLVARRVATTSAPGRSRAPTSCPASPPTRRSRTRRRRSATSVRRWCRRS